MRLFVAGLMFVSLLAVPATAELAPEDGCRMVLRDPTNPTWSKDCFIIGEVEPPSECDDTCMAMVVVDPDAPDCQPISRAGFNSSGCADAGAQARVEAHPTTATSPWFAVSHRMCQTLGPACPPPSTLVLDAQLETTGDITVPNAELDIDLDQYTTEIVIGSEGVSLDDGDCLLHADDDGMARTCGSAHLAS